MKGTGVNAERGMAHESSTFEESRSLGSSVDGIGETLRAIDFALDSGEGLPEPVTGFVSNRAISMQLKCLPARGCGTR